VRRVQSVKATVEARQLGQFVSRVTRGSRVVVVSNREPCLHERNATGIEMIRPASGLVTALEPIVRATGGLWVAHGSGSADHLVTDAKGRITVTPEDPQYTLKRVWLTKKEENGYYYSIANRALWPLCHIAYTRPFFSRRDWETYRRVNRRFCEAILEELDSDPAVVFIQDYHLALLPRMLREERPDLKLIHFWHIPWPNREAFRIFPWGEELLDGLLGNDVLGFHIQYHCNNFMDTVDRGIEALVDYEHYRIYRGGRPTYVRAFPISVDFQQIGRDAELPRVTENRRQFLRQLGEDVAQTKLFVGVDRLDYTKGIPERVKAFDILLRRHPELIGKVTFLQLAAPSRTHLEEYRSVGDDLEQLVDEINWSHQNNGWTPIRFLQAHHDYYSVLAAYGMADVLMVTSLHDGMNLVAKEFVSSRIDEDGVLILSRYTGASRELQDAILVNPFDVDEVADGMYEAFHMTEKERTRRMRRMRRNVRRNTIFDWGMKIFETLEDVLSIKEPS
jgi:trehalose 6-phosphate synthase